MTTLVDFFSVGDVVIVVITWWILFFILLPIGVIQSPTHEPGWDHGAPTNPRIKLKALYALLLTPIVWGIVRAVLAFAF